MSMVSQGPKEMRDIEFQFTSVLYGQSAPSPRYVVVFANNNKIESHPIFLSTNCCHFCVSARKDH